MKYKDLISVAPRFTRSVNVERDARVASTVDGYVITSTSGAVLGRLARALREPAGHRAWTLTGPYGSGKSAFAAYLANLVGPSTSQGGQLARRFLTDWNESLYREFFDRRKSGSLPQQGFCPIFLTGSSEPLLPALLRACSRDIKNFFPKGRPPKALKQLDRLTAKALSGKKIAPSEAVNLLVEIALGLQRSGRSQGILVIIDELGKFLEFAARGPEQDDIYILQQLAEATAQFRVPGFFLVTILHQSFERYVAGLRPSIRDEWAKIQGRFEDVAFHEPPEEFLSLLARAIEHGKHPLTRELRQCAKVFAERAYHLELAPRGMSKSQFLEVMQRCAPLHPATALVLSRLCRKFGQHQRSLFSFLVSRERHGLSNFLESEVSGSHLPFYRLPELYDYAAEALGNGLSLGEGATRWAEIQSALDRSVGLADAETDIIKTVGILSAIGPAAAVKASPHMLEFVADTEPMEVRTSTERLTRRSVLVFRKHSESFGFWQGSDIDLDVRIEDAKKALPAGTSIAAKLTQVCKPRPLVAKRHSAETGTLRYFAIRFTDLDHLTRDTQPDAAADGLLLYALPNTVSDFDELLRLTVSSAVRDRADVVVAIPKHTEPLKETVRDLELLRWVEENTPELQGDAVARRELRARITFSEERLAHELQSLFSPASHHQTVWFHRGISQQLHTSRSLSHLLSHVCDLVYPQTPHLHNELLNRRQLSSAAAAARRNLIDAMISHAGEQHLGFVGTPPEMSMYASILASTGVHRQEESGYAFGAPSKHDGLRQVWKALEKFFAGCELERRAVVDLFSLLQQPPYGLKMGVIPVLFCAAALAYDSEIAIYENGAFVPELTIELFERLLRSPEKFELRRYRIAGVRREVFNQFAALLETTQQSDNQNLVSVVRPLFRFFNRLPAYSKQTKDLSPTALAVREVLFAAREPDLLLFNDLPQACGRLAFSQHATASDMEVSRFFKDLKKALSELRQAYDDLLSDLQQVLLGAFGITGGKGREIVRFRARALAAHALESRLRAFILHLSDDELGDVAWIEAVATLLVGKPPKSWSDADRARYELTLSDLVRNFRHIEVLANELTKRTQTGDLPYEVLRVGVTDRHSRDLEAVLVVESKAQPLVAEAMIGIEEVLSKMQVGANPTLALAALAMVSRRYLSELERPGCLAAPHSTEEARRRE